MMAKARLASNKLSDTDELTRETDGQKEFAQSNDAQRLTSDQVHRKEEDGIQFPTVEMEMVKR